MLKFPIQPMLVATAAAPYNSEDHLFELKWDGIRGILFFESGKVRLHSKSGKDITDRFPELHSPGLATSEVVLDGEIVVLVKGKPCFNSVMQRRMCSSNNAKSLMKSLPASYVVWDILWHSDYGSLASLPLIERKEILDRTLKNTECISKIDYILYNGMDLYNAVIDHGLEGVIAKPINSKYYLGRRGPWEKTKNFRFSTVNVLGFDLARNILLVGSGNKVEGEALGLRGESRKAILALAKEVGRADKKGTLWLPKGIKAQVKCAGWTALNNLRDCSFIKFET